MKNFILFQIYSFAFACYGKWFFLYAFPQKIPHFSKCDVKKLIIKTNKIFNSKTKIKRLTFSPERSVGENKFCENEVEVKLYKPTFIVNPNFLSLQKKMLSDSSEQSVDEFLGAKRRESPICHNPQRQIEKYPFFGEQPNEIQNTMETTAHDTLISIIQKQVQKETQKDIWKNSPYKDLVKLQSNNVGNVGEELINTICRLTNIPADCDGSKTKQVGGGEGDGTIMGIPVEIKTAHQGSTSPSFQHELGEVPWKGSKYMIFVDISPECIYLTIFNNFDEETYKSKKKLVLFPTKSVTWRKEKGAFKLDTSVKLNEQSIEKGYAIKITPTTSNEFIASFIQRIII